MEISDVIRDIFSKLKDSDLQFIILRNYEKLPFDVENDLDVLVDPKQYNDFENATKEVFRKHNLLTIIRPIKSNSMSIIAREVQLGNEDSPLLKLCIHVQFWISFEITSLHTYVPGLSHKIFISNIEKTSVTQDECEFWIASPIHQFVLLMRQWVFKQKAAYKDKVLDLYDNNPSIQTFAVNTLRDPLSRTHVLFADPSCTASRSELKRLVKGLWRQRGRSSAFFAYFRALTTLLSNRMIKLGPVIYLAGPDGAGKTTVATMISKLLKQGKIKHKHFYSMKKNLIRNFVIRTKEVIQKRFGSNAKPSGRRKPRFRMVLLEDITDRDDGTVTWKLRKLLTLMVGIKDIFICFCAVLFFRLNGQVIIIETSPYDIFIKYHMPKFKLLESIFVPLIPSPTLGLLLTAEPAKIASRKRELAADEISMYYNRIHDILAKGRVEKRFVPIRTDESLSDMRVKLRDIVTDCI